MNPQYTPFLAEIAEDLYNPEPKEVFADKLEEDGLGIFKQVRELAFSEKSRQMYFAGAETMYEPTHYSSIFKNLYTNVFKEHRKSKVYCYEYLFPVELKNWSNLVFAH